MDCSITIRELMNSIPFHCFSGVTDRLKRTYSLYISGKTVNCWLERQAMGCLKWCLRMVIGLGDNARTLRQAVWLSRFLKTRAASFGYRPKTMAYTGSKGMSENAISNQGKCKTMLFPALWRIITVRFG